MFEHTWPLYLVCQVICPQHLCENEGSLGLGGAIYVWTIGAAAARLRP